MILASQVYRENLPPVVDADGELVAFDGTPVVTFWRNGEVDLSVTPTIEQYSTGLYVVEATITGSVGDSVWCSVFVADMDPTTIVLPVRILQSVPTVAQIQTIDDELATVDGLIDGIVAGSTVVRANNSAGEVIAAKALAEADILVDTSQSPWEMVWLTKGTGGIGVGTELMRKVIRNTAGTGITSTATVVGQVKEEA